MFSEIGRTSKVFAAAVIAAGLSSRIGFCPAAATGEAGYPGCALGLAAIPQRAALSQAPPDEAPPTQTPPPPNQAPPTSSNTVDEPVYAPGVAPEPSSKVTTVPPGSIPTEKGPGGEDLYKIVTNVNQVLVPVMVKDDSGRLVNGLVVERLRGLRGRQETES